MSDDPWSDWYSVPDLAPRLGMSAATLKRRLTQWSRAGGRILLTDNRTVEVQAEKIARPQGDEWRARVRASALRSGAAQPKADSKAPPLASAEQSDAQGFLRLVEAERTERQRIAAENAKLIERAVRAETRAETLEQTIGAQSQTITALSAARDDLAASLERERARADDAEAKSWWDKLRGR